MARRLFMWFSCVLAFALASSPAEAAVTAPDLAIYGHLPGFEMAALSPSGDRIGMIGIVGSERRLLVIDKEAKPIFAAPLGDVKVRDLRWAGETRVIIYKSGTANLGLGFTADKAELFSAIVVPLDGAKAWSVFQNETGITGGVRGFYGVGQRGGHWFGYFGGITLDRLGSERQIVSTKPVLYEVDLESRAVRRLAPRAADNVYRSWVVTGEGTVAATLDYVTGSGAWSLRNGAGKQIATGTSRLDGVDLMGLGSTPGTVIYARTNDDDGQSRWFEAPLAGGAIKEVLPNVDIARSFFDGRGRQFLGYAAPGDTPAYHFVDARRQQVVNGTLKAFPGLVVRIVDWNDGFDRLIVTTEGGDDPQTWWLVDINTHEAVPLGQGYAVDPAQVGQAKMVRYTSADGWPIAAVLTLPPGRKARNLPAVVLPHGGPAAHDELGFDWWAQAFAARGYAVLQPNFRGSTGYGAAFRRAGHGQWGLKMQTDLSDGLAYLAKEGIVDPGRVCIMGASYGGYAALAGVTLQHGVYRCAVAVAGVSDVQRMVSSDITISGDDPAMRRSLTQEIGVGRDLAAVSPLRFVDRVSAPVLLIHGQDDTVVLYEQSRIMAAALRHAGKEVEFVTLPGEDHWLSRGTTRLAMLKAAVTFVEKHNPPDPAS